MQSNPVRGTLQELVERLERLDSDAVLYAEADPSLLLHWRWDARAIAAVPGPNDEPPVEAEGLDYCLEVSIAREVVQDMADLATGHKLTLAERCAAVIYYAARDAYWMPDGGPSIDLVLCGGGPAPRPTVACPCCGFVTLTERRAYQICPVCRWLDDPLQADNPTWVIGGNAPSSLEEAQHTFARLGVSAERWRGYGRAPLPAEHGPHSPGKEEFG